MGAAGCRRQDIPAAGAADVGADLAAKGFIGEALAPGCAPTRWRVCGCAGCRRQDIPRGGRRRCRSGPGREGLYR
ncbi:hypothetical protein XAP412_450003 [Xanthomonas phaseoli pv. phaseoli]|uniref:Uncharacterized protein n=1 Tax=Xanthomonas campestris pv. phaseoli TaxID=317013 RepID=A0AB38E1N2_XANCH|nr:hypothetical protein XAP6984_500003 [Xanthomonas phaseoli pv. phaseoli]SON85804.1 hypothetical protein XAP412_450003 [Xanthomonas phaseoli pv. phaseoli]SON90340.1 hypothetical protein XAP7430_470003 [Xanthomonas phaseoli pv. phaseoli]